MDATNNISPHAERQIIHTDFCDIHLTIDKDSKEAKDAYMTIDQKQFEWLATNSDSVFLPQFFFDAYNKAGEDKYGRKVISLKTSPLLNSNSYDGFDREQKEKNWNFQIDGIFDDYKEQENGSSLLTTNPHFLKIFHNGSGRCDVVQAGAFSCRLGRNLNAGYIKNLKQKDHSYVAGIFNDKVEKDNNFSSSYGNYKGYEQPGFAVVANNKDFPYPSDACFSKHNSTLQQVVSCDVKNNKFSIYRLNNNLRVPSVFYHKDYNNTDYGQNKYDNNKITNETITDKKGLEYYKIAAINPTRNSQGDNYEKVDEYVVMTAHKLNPTYKKATLIKNKDGSSHFRMTDITEPIEVNKRDIFTSVNKQNNFVNYTNANNFGSPTSNQGQCDPEVQKVYFGDKARFDYVDDNKIIMRDINNHDNTNKIKKSEMQNNINTLSSTINLAAMLQCAINR